MMALILISLIVSVHAEDRSAILEQTDLSLELSGDEIVADSILAELKEEAWEGQNPADPWVRQFFPVVRQEYESTELFDFLQAMPKGAVLHVHPSAMGNYYELFDMVCGREDCYFNPSTESFLILTDSVPGDDWYAVPTLLASAPDYEIMRDSLIDCITVDPGDAELDDIWAEFEEMFGRVGGLFWDPSVAHAYIYNALHDYAVLDNVQHIELRVHTPSDASVAFYTGIVDSLATQGIDISIRMISCDSRYIFPGETVEDFRERILGNLQHAADMMARYPGIVVGADVYSEEDKGATAHYMAPLMEEAREYSMEEYGFSLPLYLHDGESSFPTGVPDSPVSETGPYPGRVNNNVIDAYLLGVERVGHGIELAKLPDLANMYAQAGIPLEICPVSNQILGYVADLRDHPAVPLMRSGVRISINPDDPAMFGYTGVTHDWVAVTLAWDLTLGDIKRLIVNSIEDAAMTDQERAELMTRWQTQWDAFIGEVVSGTAF
jgi:adenosine deaminase CECR1